MPWGTSAVTCNICQGGTNSERRCCLPRVNWYRAETEYERENTRANRLLQVLNRLLLAGEARALLVMQPAELLQDLGVVRVAVEHTSVSKFCIVKLRFVSSCLLHHLELVNLHLFAAREHGRSGTKCPPR